MQKYNFRAIALALTIAIGLGFGVRASAQQQSDDFSDPYVISARAGTINLAEEGTEIRREEDDEWEMLTSRQRLHSGDSLRTTGYARAEILLNPGSYLRLANDAEVEMTDAQLDRLHVTVREGAVIFEVTGTDGTELVFKVSTPGGDFYVLKAGIYRVQVSPNGVTEIRIRKGQIELADQNHTLVKGRKRVYLDANGIGYGDLAKNDRDSFDDWSADRAERLSAANAQLDDDDAQQLVSGYRQYNGNGFGYAPNFGLWIFNAAFGSYTFYPFYDDWSSPYGRNYSSCYRLPWSRYRPSFSGYAYPNRQYGSGGSSPTYQAPAKPRQPVTLPAQPGGYNNGPVYPSKPSPNQSSGGSQPNYNPNYSAPRARDKAPGTVPSYTPPPRNTGGSGSGGSSGGSSGAQGGGRNTGGSSPAKPSGTTYNPPPPPPRNPGGSSGAQGGGRNSGGSPPAASKPAPAPQAPSRPAPAPQAPSKGGGGKSPSKD